MMDLYVDSTGSDDNVGLTSDAALQTLLAAQAAVRAQLADGVIEITVHLAPGDYFLSAPFTLTDEDGPSEGLVTWQGADTGDSILNGGTRVEGWHDAGNGLYRAEIPRETRFATLYENGVPSPLCRFPAEEYLRTRTHIEDDPYRSFGFGEEDLPAMAAGQPVSVFIFPGGPTGEWNWSSSTVPVEIDFESRTARLAAGSSYSIGAGSRYYWRGAREFLGAPGQFWFDQPAGVLYYRPRSLPIEEQEIVVPLTDGLIAFRGAEESVPCRNIRLLNLVLRNSAALENGARPARSSGAVQMKNAERIELRFCHIHNVAGHGVHLAGWAQQCTVYGCHIHDVGDTGIQIAGTGARVVMTCKGNRIENNHVHDTGRDVGHGAGIQISFAGENRVVHNRIHHAPRYAISLKGPVPGLIVHTDVEGVRITPDNLYDYHFTRDNVISHNEMFRVNLDTQDTGVYESWGTGLGNRLTHNWVHDSDIAFSFGFGIYLDDASSGYTVEGNLVHRLQRNGAGEMANPVYIKGIRNRFVNNFVVNNRSARAAFGTHAYATEPCRWLSFSRNIMHQSGAVGIGFVNWDWERMTDCDHNLFGPDTAYYDWLDPNMGNRLDRWNARMRTIYDLHSVNAEPGFMDEAGEDYRLRYDAPARTIGIVDIDLVNIGLLADYPFGSSDAPPASLFVDVDGSISFATLSVGDAAVLKTHARDEEGVPFEAAATELAFSSENPEIADVDEQGRITAKAPGVAVVRAELTKNGRTVNTFVHAVVS